MPELTQETIEQIETVIIPEIKGAAEESLRAYEQGARPDGSNNFDNYMLGCACWCNVYNRLDRKLKDHHFFITKTHKKVLTIICQNGKSQLQFHVSRVDERGRIPCAGKSIKIHLQKQAFLSDEIQDIIAKSKSSVLMLGYDISCQHGLGKITLDMISSTGKGHFQSVTLHTFEDKKYALPTQHIRQEKIKRPAVTREVLATRQKKDK